MWPNVLPQRAKRSCHRHPSAAGSCHIQCHLLPFSINLKKIFLSFSLSNLRTAQLRSKQSIFGHLCLHFIWSLPASWCCQNTFFTQEWFPGPLIGDLCGPQVPPRFRCWALPHYVNSTSYNSCCSPHKWVTAAKCIFRSCSVVLM